jgi:ribosome recycling factor
VINAIDVKISVWDKGVIQNVEKALRESKLGASVSVDQDSVRLKFNPITEEDRKSTVKEIGGMLEECRIKIRQIRQRYMKDLENLQNVSEDLQKKDQEHLQKLIVEYTSKAEEIANKKEQEIMKI